LVVVGNAELDRIRKDLTDLNQKKEEAEDRHQKLQRDVASFQAAVDKAKSNFVSSDPLEDIVRFTI
jgi:peptidoglycan hydrolase CwlO-like protein